MSVPYVAPLNTELHDDRIYSFLDTVGTKECREAIHDFQTRLLSERDAILPLLKWHSKGAGLEFTYLSLEEAFEYGVLEYSFSFWQWGGKCEDIPTKETSFDDALDHFIQVIGLAFFSDKSMTDYASHYYQAGSEMGYYAYETKDFKGLIKALEGKEPTAIFMPNKSPITFDGKLVSDVAEWLPVNGDRFIYINGNADTWSATAVRPTEQVDALWFFLKDTDHGGARIRNMEADDKTKMIDALERWLEMEID